MARLLTFIVAMVSACAAARPPAVLAFELSDPAGDVRLRHPAMVGIEAGTFDLRAVRVWRRADAVVVEADFAAPVRPLKGVRTATDHARDVFPQTVDLYVDSAPGWGQVDALPGRGFRIAVAEAWDRVLVLTSAPESAPAGAIVPRELVASGHTLRATFAADALPESARGFLAVVLATAPRAVNGVRGVAKNRHACDGWDLSRCALSGSGPPVLDATADPAAVAVPLAYPGGERPSPPRVPVLWQRNVVITVAPAPHAKKGDLATVLGKAGEPVCTAVVDSVSGDVATLTFMTDSAAPEATAVIFFGGAR